MILLNFGLVLAAVALLIVGLGTGDVGLVWGSVGASVFAAACLAFVATARRRGEPVEPEHEDCRTAARDGGGAAMSPASTAGPVPEARDAEDAGSPERPDRRITRPEAAATAATDPAVESADGPAAAEPEEHPTAEDAALVAGRDDLVLVVDGRPRYHLFTCPSLADQDTLPLAVSDARGDGFTPCGRCTPDATLAQAVRALAETDDT